MTTTSKVNKIAVIGYGTVGSALCGWFEDFNPDLTVIVHDPDKGMDNPHVYTQTDIDAYFICVNIITDKHMGQDALSFMEDCLARFNVKDKPVFIRSTVLPKYLEKFRTILGFTDIHFFPEFLSEETAHDDIRAQPLFIPTGFTSLMSTIFPNKKMFELEDEELMAMKYFHNMFGALKVTFFNCIKTFCDEHGMDFKRIVDGLINTGHIHSDYTKVPGPDGKFGYGGKCFPKDIKAFRLGYPESDMAYLLDGVEQLNGTFRK